MSEVGYYVTRSDGGVLAGPFGSFVEAHLERIDGRLATDTKMDVRRYTTDEARRRAL